MSSTRIRVAFGLALCALTLTACAGQAGNGAAPPPTATHSLPNGPPPTGATGAVLADRRAIGLKAHGWTRYDVLAGSGLRIHYTITGSPQCNVLGRVEVAESADIVTITLHVGRWPTANCGAKILRATDMFTELELAAPLGTRSTKDGSA